MAAPTYYLVTPLAYTGASGAFTYQSEQPLAPGTIATVPVASRKITGVVTSQVDKPEFATKSVIGTIEVPPLPPDLLELAAWMTGYYASSPSSVFQTMLPAGIGKNRRAKEHQKPDSETKFPTSPLTPDQLSALEAIHASQRSSFLLQGVTGSGKTRVYLELARQALEKNRSVIVLVPEITLTPQIVAAFEEAFGPIVLASHSKLTESDRHRIWLEAATAASRKSPRVIIGPRSCLFMPAANLGLIVVDECHETSYKQEQHPRYQATSAAAARTRITGSQLVLGSATPGLTELFLAQNTRLDYVKMTNRVNRIIPSQGQIIDLRNKDLFKASKFITQPLLELLQSTLEAKRQSLLFLNRRGSASSQVCGDCGHVTACPNCHLPLTFHADLMRLICHHCNFRASHSSVCPECHGSDLVLLGGGTKRIEAEITRLFPDARLARLDRDSATIPHIKAVLKGLATDSVDILVGTQMIAKGLDLPAVDTVGIVNADTMLHLPDYTASERTFQLISQVSGRAGRGDRPGQVLIQTYTPDHPAIIAAAAGDYDHFATGELAERQALNYPPYVYLLKLTVTAPSREAATSQARKLADTTKTIPGVAVIGPAPAFIENQGGRFHWTITVKSKTRAPLTRIATNLPGSAWTADLDPVNLL